jgi:hypothetical protein
VPIALAAAARPEGVVDARDALPAGDGRFCGSTDASDGSPCDVSISVNMSRLSLSTRAFFAGEDSDESRGPNLVAVVVSEAAALPP